MPYAHVLIFFHPSNKYPTPNDIDCIISTEIPNQGIDPGLYNLVKPHMIHGQYGSENRVAPCMKDGKCSKFFPKKFKLKQLLTRIGISCIEEGTIVTQLLKMEIK